MSIWLTRQEPEVTMIGNETRVKLTKTQRRKRKASSRKVGSAAVDAVSAERIARAMRAVAAAEEGAKRVDAVSATWRNCTMQQVGGRLAEELHAATFNVDAALKGRHDLRAVTTAAAGRA